LIGYFTSDRTLLGLVTILRKTVEWGGGGEVGAKSELGKWSRFWILLEAKAA
jgi:hypothetical protein